MNFENTVIKNIPGGMKQPRRAQIYVGFQCHQKCGFCYYKSKCQEPMFDFEFIKQQIDFEYEYGIRDFEITGGEPSEYKYLRDVCQYIKEKNPESKIAIITNGGLFASNVWDLIDEVLISYHLSKNPHNYDSKMFPNGSTYDKVLKCIEIAKDNKILVRTNTVIGLFNIDNIDEIIQDLILFKPSIINFLPVNLFEESTDMISSIDYSRLRPILKNQICIIKKYLPKTLIFIRYMPFCDMDGYEQHIVGHLQHIYDWFDWNRELGGSNLLEKVKQKQQMQRYGMTSIRHCFEQREFLYEKSNKCLFCKYNIICDGMERSNGKLLKYICPTYGKIIKNPMFYIGDTTYQFYRDVYKQ